MGLRVEIICKETIKPSSPTPKHLRTHKLTVLDQTSPSVYVPICLFYPPPPPKVVVDLSHQTHHHLIYTLKASLSHALNAYYPLAGRYKDSFSVDCNDHGVHFLHAHVAAHLSDALLLPDQDRLLPLLPCRPRATHVDSEGRLVLLAVQANFFQCGGIAVAVCVWHGLADACTLACFLRTWAQINSAAGDSCHVQPNSCVVQDCTSLFPPRDLSAYEELLSKFKATVSTPDSKIKRFVFESEKIESLRGWSSWKERPSRVQAVSAVIWAAAINVGREKQGRRGRSDKASGCGYHVAAMTTNLRPRMNPPLAEQVMGNIVQIPVFAKWGVKEEEVISYQGLAERLRESVRAVNEENVSKCVGSEEGILQVVRCFVEEYGQGNLLAISSWCRFPFYDVDFGWGEKPCWVAFFTMCYNLVVLLDAPDGLGIEAWVTFGNDDMSKFEQDAGILQFANCNSY